MSASALRRLSRPLVVLLCILVLCWASLMMREHVDAELAVEQGGWRLWFSNLPVWFPAGFRGELVALDRLPERISLRPPAWRQRLRDALEKNPWIDRVHELRRDGARLHFSASFVRPVVAVRADGGFLLVGGDGRVIDFQEGIDLPRRWCMAQYLSESGILPRMAPGQVLRGSEFRELMSLMEPLWEARVFERWPNAIREIMGELEGEDDRRWVLRLEKGTELDWGRAPASPRLSPLSTGAKLANLVRVMDRLGELERARTVELWSQIRPLVPVD